MIPFFFTPYDILLIPAFLFALWAQMRVKSAYGRYSQVGTRSGLSGAEVAARILRDADIDLVQGEPGPTDAAVCGLAMTPGELTDHYDPRAKMLRLSEPVYGGRSIAALGIAAHEVGHAIQHARSYAPLSLRNVVYPMCSLGTTLAWPLFLIGFIFASPAVEGGWREPLMTAGILFFSVAVFFTVLTLPVEFNASRRALKHLAGGGYLDEEELAGARAVLSAAAMTYVAAAAMSIMQLLRMILLARGRN
jgi:uncharacterized protein